MTAKERYDQIQNIISDCQSKISQLFTEEEILCYVLKSIKNINAENTPEYLMPNAFEYFLKLIDFASHENYFVFLHKDSIEIHCDTGRFIKLNILQFASLFGCTDLDFIFYHPKTNIYD